MEKQLKVKILPETYPFSPRMDYKSNQENAATPHCWNGSVSCPNSPLASMISNADELSPPSAFLKSQTYFRNHSSGQNILSRNRNASPENTKFVVFADANSNIQRRHVGVLKNFTHESETIKPIYNCNNNCAEIDFDPTSPKISCMGHITYKNKPIKKGKGVEEKEHVTTFRRMFLNARKKQKRRE
ncbi:unnamed protein product [Trifolium pratense]|uniref:Uncharacterized protein n=1 Tax=Trifolium pratense TaxID=57577 RepID=A0ACB0J674_TRIPR|nr:unnamed protein product [Trifolium pratense]